MKGLVIKDFCSIKSQFKIFCLVSIFLIAMQGASGIAFSIMFTAMLPLTALAYDEKSKWDKYASMLPCGAAKIVGAKYIFGYIAIIISAVFAIAIFLVINIFIKHNFDNAALLSIIPVLMLGTVFLSVNMPVMYKIGVEKARLFIFVMIFGLSFLTVYLADYLMPLIQFISNMSIIMIIVVGVLVIVGINVISYLLSVKFYSAKEF